MKTSVSTSHPGVKSLQHSVQSKFTRPVTTLTDFEQLAEAVEAVTGEHLNADTLRRLWGVRNDGYATVRLSTLNILSRYAGCADWQTWCEKIRKDGKVESETTEERRLVRSADIETGQEVRITWLPDRLARLRYEGDNRWTVVESANSHTLQAGDTFRCSEIVEGETLYGEALTREGQVYGAVRIGIDRGIHSIVLS